MPMHLTHQSGARLREHLHRQPITPFIGIYDVFSASLAAQHFDALFVSGFSFAASHYGLPDIGRVARQKILDFVHRIRSILTTPHLLVDTDDGSLAGVLTLHANLKTRTEVLQQNLKQSEKRVN